MKRLLPLAIVALVILVPAGVVLAAKAAKTKKAHTVKVSHRTAKQKAANDKLIQELLTIMEETDNKMTFAACLECLTQLKPQRDVVVPAIIRKVDKMGWLRADGGDDSRMIGEYLLQFLPSKQQRQMIEFNTSPMTQYPCQVPPPPLPAPAIYSSPPCMPPASYPSYQIQAPMCPPAMSCPVCPATAPCPTAPACTTGSVRMNPPACTDFQIVTVMPAPAQDRLTTDLLKIIDETESKMTFAIVVQTLGQRCENWDAVIPAVIRKADKMGWLRLGDENSGDDFSKDLAEFVASKARKPQKGASSCASGCSVAAVIGAVIGNSQKGASSCASGCSCSDCECCPACCSAQSCACPTCECCPACCPDRKQSESKRSACSGTSSFAVGAAAEALPMPRCATETLPMPHAAEVLPMMPHAAEVPVFDFWMFVR
jgi:hypothetical protein